MSDWTLADPRFESVDDYVNFYATEMRAVMTGRQQNYSIQKYVLKSGYDYNGNFVDIFMSRFFLTTAPYDVLLFHKVALEVQAASVV